MWLLARPATYIQDAFVVTSLTSKSITVTTTLANAGTAAQTVQVYRQAMQRAARSQLAADAVGESC